MLAQEIVCELLAGVMCVEWLTNELIGHDRSQRVSARRNHPHGAPRHVMGYWVGSGHRAPGTGAGSVNDWCSRGVFREANVDVETTNHAGGCVACCVAVELAGPPPAVSAQSAGAYLDGAEPFGRGVCRSIAIDPVPPPPCNAPAEQLC